jgi:hypothetical protein
MWNQMRMSPRDLVDVTGATYTYLMNGHAPAGNWTGLFKTGRARAPAFHQWLLQQFFRRAYSRIEAERRRRRRAEQSSRSKSTNSASPLRKPTM